MDYRIVYTSCYRGVESLTDGFQVYRKTKKLPEDIKKYYVSDLNYKVPENFSSQNLSDYPKAYSYRMVNDNFIYSFSTYVNKDVVSSRTGNFISDLIITDYTNLVPVVTLDLSKVYFNNEEVKNFAINKKTPSFFSEQEIQDLFATNFMQTNFEIASKKIKETLTKKEFINSFAVLLDAICNESKVALKFKNTEVLLYLYVIAIRFKKTAKHISFITYQENTNINFDISGYYDISKAVDKDYQYDQSSNSTNLKISSTLELFLGNIYSNILGKYEVYQELITFIEKNKFNVINNCDVLSAFVSSKGTTISDPDELMPIYRLYEGILKKEEYKDTIEQVDFLKNVVLSDEILTDKSLIEILYKNMEELNLSDEDLAQFFIDKYKDNIKHIKYIFNAVKDEKFYRNYILTNDEIYKSYNVTTSLIVSYLQNVAEKDIELVTKNEKLINLIKLENINDFTTHFKAFIPEMSLFKMCVDLDFNYQGFNFKITQENLKIAFSTLITSQLPYDSIIDYLTSIYVRNKQKGLISSIILTVISECDIKDPIKSKYEEYIIKMTTSFNCCSSKCRDAIANVINRMDPLVVNEINPTLLNILFDGVTIYTSPLYEALLRNYRSTMLDEYHRIVNNEYFIFYREAAEPFVNLLLNDELETPYLAVLEGTNKLSDDFKKEFNKILIRTQTQEMKDLINKIKKDVPSLLTQKLTPKEIESDLKRYVKKGLFGVKVVVDEMEELDKFLDITEYSSFNAKQIELLMKAYQIESRKPPVELSFYSMLYEKFISSKPIFAKFKCGNEMISKFIDFLNKYKINLFKLNFDVNRIGVLLPKPKRNLEKVSKYLNNHKFKKEIKSIKNDILGNYIYTNVVDRYDVEVINVSIEELVKRNDTIPTNIIYSQMFSDFFYRINDKEYFDKYTNIFDFIVSELSKVKDIKEINELHLLLILSLVIHIYTYHQFNLTFDSKILELMGESLDDYIEDYLYITLMGEIPHES